MRTGVVIFDDAFRRVTQKNRKQSGTTGWASIEGGTANRIISISELASDVKWLTNFDFVDFNAHLLARHPNMFFSGFLRTEFRALTYEIGCGVELKSADIAAQMMSVIFSRVVKLAIQKLGVQLDGGSGVRSLPDLIAARTTNRNKMNDELNGAMERAYQAWTSCTQPLPKGWKSITLKRPRYEHAIDVLATAVPGETRWMYIDQSRLPNSSTERLDWCVNSELPVVANAIVKPQRSHYTNLLSYNAGATISRDWISQPELVFLSQFCDIEVIGAFACQGGFEVQPEVETFPSLGDYSHASYSLGLLVENLWMSMANPRIGGQKNYPPRSVWYRAVDRITMFFSAAHLQKSGFQISGYGNGQLVVCYPPGATEDLLSQSIELNLDVPVTKFAEVRNEVRLENDEQRT